MDCRFNNPIDYLKGWCNKFMQCSKVFETLNFLLFIQNKFFYLLKGESTKVRRRKVENTKLRKLENAKTRKYDDENAKTRNREKSKTRKYDDENAKTRWRKLDNYGLASR